MLKTKQNSTEQGGYPPQQSGSNFSGAGYDAPATSDLTFITVPGREIL
jgi:hypothetical protein